MALISAITFALGNVYRSARTIAAARTVADVREPVSATALPPTITVVVPARNEETVLDDCLRAIRSQTYAEQDQSVLRVVVVDDGSTDRTGDIARNHADEDGRVTVVRCDGPPAGWSGKVHAMHVGVEASGLPAPGEWLLFVDADVRLGSELLARLLATAEALDADLVSTPGGPPPGRSATWPLLMPPGLQMIAENAGPDGRGRRAFAIGHCILLRRSHYDKVGGWAALADRRNEDVAIATSVRDHGGTTRTVDALDHLTTTGMDPFAQGWASFRKSFVAGVQGSAPLLVGIGLGQALMSVVPVAAVTAGARGRRPVLAVAGLVGWAAQAAAYSRTARLMRVDQRLAPLAPFAGALFAGVLFDGAIRAARGATSWKGRRTRF